MISLIVLLNRIFVYYFHRFIPFTHVVISHFSAIRCSKQEFNVFYFRRHVALEYVCSSRQLTPKSNVYSFGGLLVEIVSGRSDLNILEEVCVSYFSQLC